MGKRILFCAVLLGLLFALACGGQTAHRDVQQHTAAPAESAPAEATEEPAEEIVLHPETERPTKAQETLPPEPTAVPATPVPEITPEPTEAPTSVPAPVYVKIGAVGDIMIPSQIVEDAKIKGGEYDFTALFAPFADLFGSVDLMCGNLETPLAGKEAGFSQKKDVKTGAYVFNAPDSVLDALKLHGVDMLTTANNHCLDMGPDGLFRTIETIRSAGFYQTGSYLNAADREVPCVIELNGVRVGFVASTIKTNSVQSKKTLSDAEKQTVVGYLQKGDRLTDAVVEDIARVRRAGAEFVIVFAHWDRENDGPTADVTKKQARMLLESGADCIIGSHPHRIKGAEYMTVQRADGPYTGLVLYSLGNFTANNRFELMVGLFAEITLEKNFETGEVRLSDAAVLPTITMRRSGSGQRFAVIPAYADTSRISGLRSELTASEVKTIAKAREHAFKRLGKVDGLRLLDEP